MPKNDMDERKKHWVRLTRTCNNRCVFCLDSDEQDGTVIPTRDVIANLEKGIGDGCSQAVLSGGEPTLHPDFFRIISESKNMGYSWVQVITNGRMFSDAGFFEKAVSAGLDETTFSMHDIDPELMDAQTRAPGSFNETMKGLIIALAKSRLAVSVDIVLSGINAGRLKSIVAGLSALGASEFDILYPIPFGEAWINREKIFFDIGQHLTDISETIEFCEKQGIRIWMNRMPPPALEGAERFIQKPGKLHAEVAGKLDMFEDFANRGIKPPCMGTRCEYCHVRSFCGALSRLASDVGSGQPLTLRVTPENVSRLGHPFPFRPRMFILEEEALLESDTVLKLMSDKDIRAELIYSEPPASAALVREKISQIYIEINKLSARTLLERGMSCLPSERAKLILRNRLSLEETLEKDIKISGFAGAFMDRWSSLPAMVNVPPCITGMESFIALSGIPADVFNVDSSINLQRFTIHHIESGMYSRSARCAGCNKQQECPGLHVNHIRAFDFSVIPGPPK
jgi:MoaA/NifB/PqqE/SkfB family radical SAM enzyme